MYLAPSPRQLLFLGCIVSVFAVVFVGGVCGARSGFKSQLEVPLTAAHDVINSPSRGAYRPPAEACTASPGHS